MPKGVEHILVRDLEFGSLCVKVPLMPKGVEHLLQGNISSSALRVKVPLMPKGVEHSDRVWRELTAIFT